MRNSKKTNRFVKTFLSIGAVSAFFLLSMTANCLAASYVSVKLFPEHVGVFTTVGKQQFVAFGITAAGAAVNITDEVDWISSNENLVTIDDTGMATIKPLITAGQVKVTCSYPKTGGTVAGPNHLLLQRATRP